MNILGTNHTFNINPSTLPTAIVMPGPYRVHLPTDYLPSLQTFVRETSGKSLLRTQRQSNTNHILPRLLFSDLDGLLTAVYAF
jgi:hypothetical protein